MRFAHIADTHIKNLKYHYEYKEVFKQLYETLREQKIDCIIHCGDIAHTKTQISPEFVELCSDFFRNLASIAPTYIILGNHDGNLKNSSRQDAITPIVDALGLNNIYLLKNAGEHKISDDFCLNVLSVFDEENWCQPSNPDAINIALYHGSISGSKTDIGWVMDHGEHDITIFEEFDFGFLGDIHKTNQILDSEGRIRYPGSTIQQNHGETNDKGLLLWDIQDKENFTCKHIAFKNPKPFITIELTPKGRIPKGTKIQTEARLRLVSNNNLPLDRMRRAVEVAKHRFNPESITFLNRAAGERNNVDSIGNSLIKMNLRDLAVQEKLIREYLKDYELEEEIVQKVLDLNKKYNKIVEEDEEVSRNINWKLQSLEWDNLFNYGKGNRIDFDKLNGIVGIFGKNYSGKSSIIDSVLYTLFNSTSKNERKNLNIINQNRDVGRGKLRLKIGDEEYQVERTSEKYVKKLKGETTQEAKTDLEFTSENKILGEERNHNGLTRNETDKNIRKMFGTLDDFLLTSMASQLDSLSFIKEGSTKRKEILAKFLDLEIFDKKFKMAKEDATDLRGALKRLEGRNFEEDITEATEQLTGAEKEIKRHKKECVEYENKIVSNNQALDEVVHKIESIPAEIVDIANVMTQLTKKKEQIASFRSKNKNLKADRTIKQDLYEKITKFIEDFDVETLNEKKSQVDSLQHIFDEHNKLYKQAMSRFDNIMKKIKMLEDHEYDPDCKYCCENKFVKDAHAAANQKVTVEQESKEYQKKAKAISSKIDKLEPGKIDEHLKKYQQILEKKITVSTDIADLNLQIEKNKTSIEKVKSDITELQRLRQSYEDNKEAIENLEGLLQQKANVEKRIADYKDSYEMCQEELKDLYMAQGSAEQRLQNFEEQKDELEELREEYSAYDLFMRCMHTGGISYDIIKKKLPVVNEEIAKVLANIVNFEAFFEDDGKKLNIFIKHPKHEPRPLEMGSGAEKTIAAMAIRLSLLSVSSLPKSDIFILDEPGTALDADNMEGFVRIMDMIKNYYKTVLLISHMDTLKDVADIVINVEKKRGYAHVNI